MQNGFSACLIAIPITPPRKSVYNSPFPKGSLKTASHYELDIQPR